MASIWLVPGLRRAKKKARVASAQKGLEDVQNLADDPRRPNSRRPADAHAVAADKSHSTGGHLRASVLIRVGFRFGVMMPWTTAARSYVAVAYGAL